jgi:hypothetical protein
MDRGASLAVRIELRFVYDENMRPIGATCSSCGEKMPKPDPALKDAAEIVMWFSERFLEHRNLLKHSQEDRRRIPRD